MAYNITSGAAPDLFGNILEGWKSMPGAKRQQWLTDISGQYGLDPTKLGIDLGVATAAPIAPPVGTTPSDIAAQTMDLANWSGVPAIGATPGAPSPLPTPPLQPPPPPTPAPAPMTLQPPPPTTFAAKPVSTSGLTPEKLQAIADYFAPLSKEDQQRFLPELASQLGVDQFDLAFDVANILSPTAVAAKVTGLPGELRPEEEGPFAQWFATMGAGLDWNTMDPHDKQTWIDKWKADLTQAGKEPPGKVKGELSAEEEGPFREWFSKMGSGQDWNRMGPDDKQAWIDKWRSDLAQAGKPPPGGKQPGATGLRGRFAPGTQISDEDLANLERLIRDRGLDPNTITDGQLIDIFYEFAQGTATDKDGKPIKPIGGAGGGGVGGGDTTFQSLKPWSLFPGTEYEGQPNIWNLFGRLASNPNMPTADVNAIVNSILGLSTLGQQQLFRENFPGALGGAANLYNIAGPRIGKGATPEPGAAIGAPDTTLGEPAGSGRALKVPDVMARYTPPGGTLSGLSDWISKQMGMPAAPAGPSESGLDWNQVTDIFNSIKGMPQDQQQSAILQFADQAGLKGPDTFKLLNDISTISNRPSAGLGGAPGGISSAKDIANTYKADINEAFDEQERMLEDTLAARGISSSTVGSEERKRLTDAKARALANADLQAMQVFGAEKRADVASSLGVLREQFGQKVSQDQLELTAADMASNNARSNVGLLADILSGKFQQDLQKNGFSSSEAQRIYDNTLNNLVTGQNMWSQQFGQTMQPLAMLLSAMSGVNVAPGTVAPLQMPRQGPGAGEGFGQALGGLISNLPFMFGRGKKG